MQRRSARLEVPVEAALGHAPPPRQRLHRDCRHAVLGDQVERGLGPVLGTQAPLAFRLFGGRCRCDRHHRHSVSIRPRPEQYRFQIGTTWCWERVCPYGSSSVVAYTIKKKTTNSSKTTTP